MRPILTATAMAALALSSLAAQAPSGTSVHVTLDYGAPADGRPKPNFSPKGMQVPLTDAPAAMTLPAGAIRPAKTGTLLVGPSDASHMRVLATATAAHPDDLCLLFVDRNRNGRFDDDGPGLPATPSQREKTMQWWSSMNAITLDVPYAAGTQPYLVNVWLVRDDHGAAPDVLRFSVGSWRSGAATINGVPALVAAMDSDNNAVFDRNDMWSVVEAAAPNAPSAVLSINEARPTSRLMFLEGPREQVLEFRGFSADGTGIDLAVVDKPVTKAADRKADDTLGPERTRPRAKVPFTWAHALPAALTAAKASRKAVFIDFETTWCGPCKSMDEWIWTDAEVAGVLTSGFIGVKLDGDVEKALVKRYAVAGYPTMLAVDASGKELWRAVGYQSSAEMLALFSQHAASRTR